MGKILVVGSLNMDFSIDVESFPKPGETILGNSLQISPGGKGANQAYAVGKLGGQVSMIGCVGSDDNGRAMLKNLESAGVGTKGVQMLTDAPTGMAMITVDASGQNHIIVVSGANFRLDRQMLDQNQDLIRACDIVLTQLETPVETVQYLAELSGTYGKTFVLDPAPAIAGLPEDIWKNVTITKPNETELGILTGTHPETEEEIHSAAKLLLAKGVKNVLTTLGEKGVIWSRQDGYTCYPAHKVKAVDTTAAGDAFIAALVCELAEGRTMEEAIAFASAVSAIAVTRKGAQQSIPVREEVVL